MRLILTLTIAAILTACGGGEPEAEYETPAVSEQRPDTPRPSNPCANPEACK